MEQKELNRILTRGEGLRIEFKEAQNGVSDSLYDTIASFLNREGGIILLGVDDNAGVLGLLGQNLMQLKKDIVTALNNPDVLNPPFPLAVNEVQHNNDTLLYIRIPISSFVHKHANVIYDRENDSDFRITDEARIGEMYARKQSVFTENQIFTRLRVEDLDPELFIHLSQLSDTQLSAEHVATLKELPLDLSLKNITDIDELAIHLIRHWHEKSGELHSVRFLLNKQLELDELKNVGSWSEKSGELLKKRARVLLSTLLLTLQPIALEELAIALGYRSKERYRDDYVKPLKDNNLIAYTLEQANDPNQQYLITERGKSFLVGSSI